MSIIVLALIVTTLFKGHGQTAGMPTIEIADDALILNGTRLELPIERKQLDLLLGEPDRQQEKANLILTWDKLGIHAYQIPESELIRALEISFEKESHDFISQKTFSGVLKVEGAVVTSESTVEAINESIQYVQFVPVEDEDDWWELLYETGVVILTTRGPEAVVTQVAFDLREDDDDEW